MLAWANEGGEESSDDAVICRPLSPASGLALEGDSAVGGLTPSDGCTKDGRGGEEAMERKSCKCSGLMSAGLAGRETGPEAIQQKEDRYSTFSN